MIESKLKAKNCNRHRQHYCFELVGSHQHGTGVVATISWLTDRLLNAHGNESCPAENT